MHHNLGYLRIFESTARRERQFEEAKREFGLVIRHGSVRRTQCRVCVRLLGVGGGPDVCCVQGYVMESRSHQGSPQKMRKFHISTQY